MIRQIPMYVLTLAMLALAVYLHSATIVISIVALWGVRAMEEVFSGRNKAADVTELNAAIVQLKSKVSTIEHNVVSMAERAKNILGDY